MQRVLPRQQLGESLPLLRANRAPIPKGEGLVRLREVVEYGGAKLARAEGREEAHAARHPVIAEQTPDVFDGPLEAKGLDVGEVARAVQGEEHVAAHLRHHLLFLPPRHLEGIDRHQGVPVLRPLREEVGWRRHPGHVEAPHARFVSQDVLLECARVAGQVLDRGSAVRELTSAERLPPSARAITHQAKEQAALADVGHSDCERALRAAVDFDGAHQPVTERCEWREVVALLTRVDKHAL
mmetsp:Transcript_35166/g.75081  ORF Transcript_35166/g.75081 Transcript_35166/m.75081 type:complete len:240 (-) Transcript_35166:631-1350(-)